MEKPNENQQTIVVVNNTSNSLGIASTVFGFISIFIFSPIFVPLALLLGIIAVIKKQILWGVIGIVFSIIGFVTSPILMSMLGLAGTAGAGAALQSAGGM